MSQRVGCPCRCQPAVREQRPTRGPAAHPPLASTNQRIPEEATSVVRCPVCAKVLQVYVLAPKRTSCYFCGARWVQRGEEQTAILGSKGRHPAGSSDQPQPGARGSD